MIAVAEDFYAAHSALARFQVCPGCPPDLDDALSLRSYEWGDVVSLQVASRSRVTRYHSAPALRVDCKDRLDAEWFRLLMAASQIPDADQAPEWQLLQRVDRPSAYVTAFVSGRPVAVARAVADRGWAGVFNMATLPDARRRGAGRAILARLADWASSQGCAHMYLQVTRDSTAALRFYRRAGFEKLCLYHYRISVPR
jgi:GNAT superfamily N-acetyltransferase